MSTAVHSPLLNSSYEAEIRLVTSHTVVYSKIHLFNDFNMYICYFWQCKAYSTTDQFPSFIYGLSKTCTSRIEKMISEKCIFPDRIKKLIVFGQPLRGIPNVIVYICII